MSRPEPPAWRNLIGPTRVRWWVRLVMNAPAVMTGWAIAGRWSVAAQLAIVTVALVAANYQGRLDEDRALARAILWRGRQRRAAAEPGREEWP